MKKFTLVLAAGLLLNSFLCSCRENDEVLITTETTGQRPVDSSSFDDDSKDPPKDPPKDRDNWRNPLQ